MPKPQARETPARRGGIERKDGAEGERGECRDRRRHEPEVVQTDVDPGHARAEQAGAEGEASREGVARGSCAPPERPQRSQRQKRNWPEAGRSEAEDGERAGGKGRDRGGALRLEDRAQALAGRRCTCRVCSLRPSARRTWMRRLPIVTPSPRFGRRPKRCRTSPPTVSNSSSGKSVSKARLKSAISVCALTR